MGADLWLPGPMASEPGGSGRFDAYAVSSRWGPHVTLQAGVVHLGRHWTTSTRRSVKVRSVQRTRWASATVCDGRTRRIIGGPATVLDGLRPWSFATDPVAGTLAGGAVLRLGAAHLGQLVGYAEAWDQVPGAFAPWGRALLVLDVQDEVVLDGTDVVAARGRWLTRAGGGARAGGVRRSRRPVATTIPGGLPREIDALALHPRECWLGLEDDGRAVAVPARWEPDPGRVVVAAAVVDALGAHLPGRVCVTFDDSSSRRPDCKVGLMLRGTGAPAANGPGEVAVTVAAERATWWQGFDTRTVDA